MRNRLTAYAFILPNFLGFVAFVLVPVLASFVLCFTEWDTSNPIQFKGLGNFLQLLKDDAFITSFWNTVYYTGAVVPLTMAVSLGLAVMLDKKLKGAKVFRSIFFIPYIASLVAISVVWNMIFSPEAGPVNSFLRSIGLSEPPLWTSSVHWAMPVIIFVGIWRFVGYYMVLYLAGLQGIPRELYEAAEVDGATAWQQFRKITLPMLTPTTFFVVIMLVINSFKVFDQIMVMTQGGPGRATHVLVFYIYYRAFQVFEFGYASAIAFVLFLVVLTITIIQFRMEEKWVKYM
ncbi:MAG: sugar ABC transporter permease [Clostridia bacterium]|nr:sugar ABC transporter permease [Clostridia bacterium]